MKLSGAEDHSLPPLLLEQSQAAAGSGPLSHKSRLLLLSQLLETLDYPWLSQGTTPCSTAAWFLG